MHLEKFRALWILHFYWFTCTLFQLFISRLSLILARRKITHSRGVSPLGCDSTVCDAVHCWRGFILGAVHNPVILIVVAVFFGMVAALFIWNRCWGRRAVIGYIARYPDAELRTAKDGQYVSLWGM